MKKFFSLLLICLSFLTFVLFGSTKVEAEENYLSRQCNSMIQYFSNHLEELQEEYNNHIESWEDKLHINKIEGYSLIQILDNNSYGIYLDFDGDNGYLLTSFSFQLYELETKGDLKYLKDVSMAYYHTMDGFMYYDGIQYQKYEKIEAPKVHYGADGQNGNGDGIISNLPAYVADRYNKYNLEKEYNDMEHNYYCTTQDSTSYYANYVSTDGGYTYEYSSEGNCAPNAIFNMMNLWQYYKKMPNLPSENDREDFDKIMENHGQYAAYGTGQPGVGIDSYWTVNPYALNRMFALYAHIREYSYRYYGYTPEIGLSLEDCIGVVNWISYYYGYKIEALTTDTFTNVQSFLDNGNAVFLGVNNSSTYGNHAMCILGYSKYSYTSGWWVFAETHVKYFYLVDDGHHGGPLYFDPNWEPRLVVDFIYY